MITCPFDHDECVGGDCTCWCHKRARRGWFGMPCWNGLSIAQQRRLIGHGNLPLGYRPEGICERGAEVGIELPDDVAPGPRFYCMTCAVQLLTQHIEGAS